MPAPKKDKRLKRYSIHVQLSGWILSWLSTQRDSRPDVIEKALIEYYRLKPPTEETTK